MKAMWENRRWRSSMAVAGITIGVFILAPVIAGPSLESGARLNAALVAGTLATLLWYTIETNLMQEAIQEQSRLSVKPLLIGFITGGGDVFELTNAGNGSAVDIEIDSVYLSTADVEFRFSPPAVIRAGDTQEAAIRCLRKGEEVPDTNFRAHLWHEYANRQFSVLCRYKDIMGLPHTQTYVVGKKPHKII